MNTELTARDYLDLFRRRLWIVVGCLAAGVVIALLYSASQTALYRSSARILINQTTTTDIFDPVTGVPVNFADRVATNEVQLLQSQLVREEAVAKLGFSARIGARAESRTDIVVVSSVDPDPQRARLVAQTYAETYLEVRRTEFSAERFETAAKINERINEITVDIEAAPAGADVSRQLSLRDDLADSYDRLIIIADLGNTGSARIIDDATLPRNPISPRTRRNLALGALFGLLVGSGTALLVESLDRSIKDRETIEALTPGTPSLVQVPPMRSDSHVVALENPDGVETEVFRTLRAAIDFAAVDRAAQVIQVTSPGASAGKTTIAANLAVVMAQAGQRVVVIDGDLRRPRLHSMFGVQQVPGISSVIVGHDSGANSSHAMTLNNGMLWVFPSGPIPPGPSELLGSERAQKTFGALRKSADVIIIDSAPVLPVADALVLSRHVDAVLLVANAERTKRDDMARAFAQLQQAGAHVIGTVLNNAKAGRADGYGYGYGYGYGASPARPTFFGRSKNFAPQIEGTETIASSELPRFQVARRPKPAPDRDEASSPSARRGKRLSDGELAWLRDNEQPTTTDGKRSSSTLASTPAPTASAKDETDSRTGRGADAGRTDDWSDEIEIQNRVT